VLFGENGQFESAVRAIHRSPRFVIAEVTSRADAQRAVAADSDGLIVSGNEAGGWGGTESSFVLLQAVLAEVTLPVWVRGGIGPNVAAGCWAAGAAGVVLDGALLLARESPVSAQWRERIARWDGSETACVEPVTGAGVRIYALPGSLSLARLRYAAVLGDASWKAAVRDEMGWSHDQCVPVGQDAALADRMAGRFVTVGGIIQAVERAIAEGITSARVARPLVESSPLAAALGTRFPVLQGPMTQVSDVAGFARAVATGGGLPFVGLASLRGAEVRTLLIEPAQQLGARPWGVGILDFVPPELRAEQLAAVMEVRPPFALIDGDLPQQAAELERDGVITYLHVPSAGLLEQHLRNGFRRFVLGGRECGGHVGPTPSFVLWEQAVGVVNDAIDRGVPAEQVSLVFTGGIHDARSAALVAAVAGPLAERGVKIGVLVGTDYLFTVEAVATGVAALRNQATTVADLHRELCIESMMLVAKDRPDVDSVNGTAATRPSDIAIIGMAAVFPGAASVSRFWSNTLNGVDSITEVPADRWDWRLYYDPDPKAPDKIVSKWGGFLPDVAFDPLRYGMPPSSLPSIEPAQLLALEVVRTALADAGYAERPFPREQTGVVLGMGGGAAQLAMGYAFRSYLPMLDTVIPAGGKQAIESCRGFLPEWTEDSFPGFLLNVTAGRIANRLNLGGANYTVDAACGSSLAAASLAVRELETGAAEMVILGGVDTVQNPFTYLAFSKTQAFSPRGRCRPFDASADGIVISEGVAAVVLKRLADAERDGDRIYAVIKGVGASSDGRARGLTAPVVDGQMRALKRAYSKAGVSPATVGYVEAHGTGTALGDVVEIEALGQLFREAGAKERDCVVGSVKSMIGHTKCAAGLAGLINASLGLYHRVLPPTIGITNPNPKLDLTDGPFRLCTQTQPWLHSRADRPRRAGVSAFGFGGTNFHAVLEAYDRNVVAEPSTTVIDWPAELLVWQADHTGHLVEQIDHLAQALDSGARPTLADLSHTFIRAWAMRGEQRLENRSPTLAIVTASHQDLRDKLRFARAAIAEGRSRLDDPRGVVFESNLPWSGQPVAFLFPGQGAQSPGMLRELAVVFPEVRNAFEEFDRVLLENGGQALGPLVFPPPAYSDGAREAARQALMETDVAQPAVGAACVGMLRLLRQLGCDADVLGGHSYGELVALHAAGVLTAPALAEMSSARGRFMRDAGRGVPGSMAALLAGPDDVEGLLREISGAQVANWNGPSQTVIAGPTASVKRVLELATARGIQCRTLPVSCAFHTPLVAPAREPLTAMARSLVRRHPDRPVYSNLDAARYSSDPGAIATQLGDHLAAPVRFANMITKMHQDGARVFIEVGPGSILTPLVETILKDQPCLVVACDSGRSTGLTGLLRALARLVVAGLPLRLERLTKDRSSRILDLDHLKTGAEAGPMPASTWLVNGTRARPLRDPEPIRLGQTLPQSMLERKGPPNSFHANGSPPIVKQTGSTPASSKPNSGSTIVSRGERAGGTEGADPRASTQRNSNLDLATSMKTSAVPPSSSDRAFDSFQQTMQMFLEVQKSTMLAYLAGRRSPGSAESAVLRAVAADGARIEQSSRPDTTALEASREAVQVPGGRQSMVERPSPIKDRVTDDAFMSTHKANGTLAHRNGKPMEPIIAPAPTPGLDRASITDRLLEIVRDRTGYPIETLGLDLDLEADLGIDSIKRVEILGKLRDEFPGLKALSDTPEMMDAMARARTLGVIVDRITSLTDQAIAAPRASAEPSTPTVKSSTNGVVPHQRATRRRLLEIVDAPLLAQRLGLMEDGRIVVTDDAQGVSRVIEKLLRAAGANVERIGGPDEPVDWASPVAVQTALDGLRSRGPLAGIVHALPFSSGRTTGRIASEWTAKLGIEVRGLFLLAQAMATDLEHAAQAGGACLIAATALGGRFASAGCTNAEFDPGQGGMAGLVKTLAREWPSVRSRVVDFARNDPIDTVAKRLVAEMFANDGWAEVGYDRGQRIRLRAVERPLERRELMFELKPGEPLLISGGARGITALAAAELARAWKPTLLIVGTTPLPRDGESSDTLGVKAEGELKAAFHARLLREGRTGSPAEIETLYQGLRRAREVRENLETLRETGATVAYAQADVRDPGALARVLDEWRTRHGEIVGLIHGAGLIKDKLIRHKSVESFDRVLETKLDGALNLIRLLRPDALKFTALFSSIAGRFGNVGQSDYAAANEMLNKLAHWLDRRWPGRVVSLIWGPWSGVGMVSQLEDHLGRRGLGLIAPEVGSSLLLDELRHGRKGDVEVIYSGELGTLEQPIPAQMAAEPAEAVS
jgi:acyl transferase domain-containing protein/NAD(P)H-dependent flavin oxidoreductase YrpB (nitropropane dioxygenase family)